MRIFFYNFGSLMRYLKKSYIRGGNGISLEMARGREISVLGKK
jgi:hypothetical protein